MTPEGTPDRVKAKLKEASRRAYDELQAEGFTAPKVAYATGLSEAVVRRLKSDGDKSGWRVPTPRTARAIDQYCLTRLGRQFRLLALREEFDRCGGIDVPSATTRSTTTIRAYLADLRNTVVAASPWLPFTAIDDDGFQLRKVTVSESAPRRAPDAEIASAMVRRGEVPWETALSTTRVAAVIADAGYGKSWQSRRQVAQLATDGLSAADPADVALPLWMHAADLARAWPATNPYHAVADAATLLLREVGVDTGGMQDAVANALADPEWPCVVVVDAYDEIVGVRQRGAARLALNWISRWAREGSGRQLIVTSRAAGWDDPVVASGSDSPTAYLYLGALEEVQVRRLWQAWFERRSTRLPQDRLESVLAPGSSLRQFARIPLIAAFCAWVAESTVVASTRAQLFDQVVEKFLARTWKVQDTSSGDIAGDPDDGARRAAMATALGELAWEMAITRRWVEAVSVGDCETLLSRSRSVAPGISSLTFEAVRGIGILVQPAAIQGDRLGDGPVTWIHRSVHEFMTARHLRTLPPDVVADVADRAWHHPALSGVLDFTLGLEPLVLDSDAADTALTPVRAAIVAVIDGDRDPLGYYSTLVAASGQCTRADIDRVWALYRAGVVSAVTAAQSLATSGSDADWQELVARLRDDPSMVAAEVHEGLAWCGPPGRAALSEIVATDPSAAGASNALYRVDPDAAVAAVEARIAAGFPLAASDGPCLQNIGADAFARLLENARNAPHVGTAAAALGYSHRPEALQVLLEHLSRPEAAVRHAAARGISGWYGNALDADGFATLVNVALHDPDRQLRLAARGSLTAIGVSVPWVARAIDDLFEPLHDSGDDPPMTDVPSIAARLWPVGPATHKCVIMLSLEPALVQPEMMEALGHLLHAGLGGQLDVMLTKDLALMIGEGFRDAALADLAADTLDRGSTINLAVGLSYAFPQDADVFDALVVAAIRHPALLLEAAIQTFGMPSHEKIVALAQAIDSMEAPNRAAVQVCSAAIRRLLDALADAERRELRPICQAVTIHALQLSR